MATRSPKRTTYKLSSVKGRKKTSKKTSQKMMAKSVKKIGKKMGKKKGSSAHLLGNLIDSSSFLLEKKTMLQARRVYSNESKRKIALDMLERYTGHEASDFQPQIILTNFHYYIERFSKLLDDAHYTRGSAFQAATSKKAKVTIIEFGIGSSMAALIIELLGALQPKAVLFLGLCGAVHPSLNVGDFILPIAAIRAEGVSTHFMPPQVPALPTFKIQKFVSQILVEHDWDYRTGTIHSTDLRFWEFDQRFKENLFEERVLAVEMETAALFVTGFASKVPIGALLLVSDCPLRKGGIKTKKSASKVFSKYSDVHIELGVEIMADIAERGEKIRHYRW